MATGFVSKLALASVAAVGLYAPTLGLPLPLNACLQTGGVANAAPSPTCASDLRECLHASVKTGLYGVRYVTADDVARCMETFNSCIHGGASAGGSRNPPASTELREGNNRGLPQHLGIETTGDGKGKYDCQINGDSVSCTEDLREPFGTTDSYSAKFTGTLSGLTATGTFEGHQTGHSPADPSCRYEQDISGPATYAFKLDGVVLIQQGPAQVRGTDSCSGPNSVTIDTWESTGKWSEIK
ncbi:MAG: hypothetical protein ACOYBX_15515 [Mycobacterium sp.]